MAVVFATGFEAQQAATDNITLTGTAAYSTAQHQTGAASMRCNPASGASGYITGANSNGNYTHFGLYVASLPSLARVIGGIVGGSSRNLALNSDGTLAVRNDTTVIGTSSVALTTGQWYWIGWLNAVGTSVDLLQINGVTQVTGTTTGTISTDAIGARGTEASAIDIYIDDVIADNAGFLAPSKVDFALPISDNTVTGVTDNNGVTTNIWQCVSNTPPAGVASANEAANPKAGMHFPASTTCNYLANLETYTTLGVQPSDTVVAVQAVVRHGEDVATGTKNLQNVGDLTNPTVSGLSVVVGGDAGAHAAETGLWKTTIPNFSISPSVTLGTSPTIRTARASESRLACVDFMAMLVVWTPSTAVQVPYFNPMPPFLAQ